MIKYVKIQPHFRSFILVMVAVTAMSGILLDSLLQASQIVLLIGAFISLACTFLFWQNSKLRYASFIIFCLLLGAWRYAISSPIGDPRSINAFIGAGKAEVQGTVTDDPKLLSNSRLLLVAVNALSLNNGSTWQDAHGQIEVEILGATLDNPYGPNYGDTVEMQGELQLAFSHHSPEVLASMSFPRLNVVGSTGNPIFSSIFKLRMLLASIIEQSLPQREAALLVAIFLSLQTPAMQPLIQAFTSTGTAHLIAPSGFKITILAGIVYSITNWFSKRNRKPLTPLLPAQKREGLWRQWIVTSVVILCIIIYSILNGAGPAAQRACIMGIILALAPRFGRVYNIYTALALTALLMCLFDPFELWNTGFQLSTFGTLGIVVLTPLLLRIFRPFEHLLLATFVFETIAVTLAAEIATLPIFASTFDQISLIAPIANVLTVPLLSTLIMLGLAVCIGGVIFPVLGIYCGYITWPVLWYTESVIKLCASIPWANLPISNLDIHMAWSYYALLFLLSIFALRRWSIGDQQPESAASSLLQPQGRVPVLQYMVVFIIILGVGVNIATIPDSMNEQLSITFMRVGPAGKPVQGEAILIRTPDDKTVLIDGGPDAMSLAEELDSRLPFWQRSIDRVILTSPRQDQLIEAQDAINRFQVSQALDAGMLHPSTGYALWRHTINDHNIPYSQVREGASFQIGTQASIQVLWPPSTLHKGTLEEYDNTLVFRLITPSFSILFLGTASLSPFALNGLLSTINPGYLKSDIVQVVGEPGKLFPVGLMHVLQSASPTLVVITPASGSSKHNTTASTSAVLPAQIIPGSWQVVQTAQTGSITITSSTNGWNLTPE